MPGLKHISQTAIWPNLKLKGIHTIDAIRGQQDLRLPVGQRDPDFKRVGAFFLQTFEEDIPDLYSECLTDAHPGHVDTKWDGCSVSEAGLWNMSCEDALALKSLGFPPEAVAPFFLARLRGKAGGFEQSAQNVQNYAQRFRLKRA